jgi:hypothetical protein
MEVLQYICKMFIVSSSLAVSLKATMDATLQAVCLVGTTIHLVFDYQFAKVEGPLPFSTLSQNWRKRWNIVKRTWKMQTWYMQQVKIKLITRTSLPQKRAKNES